MGKHTPGPWHMVERSGHTRKGEKSFDIMAGPKDSPHEWDMICDKPVEANARLIAAAPDLLEACNEFVRFADLPNKVDRGDYIRYQVNAIHAARLAIARAELQNPESCDESKERQ